MAAADLRLPPLPHPFFFPSLRLRLSAWVSFWVRIPTTPIRMRRIPDRGSRLGFSWDRFHGSLAKEGRTWNGSVTHVPFRKGCDPIPKERERDRERQGVARGVDEPIRSIDPLASHQPCVRVCVCGCGRRSAAPNLAMANANPFALLDEDGESNVGEVQKKHVPGAIPSNGCVTKTEGTKEKERWRGETRYDERKIVYVDGRNRGS